MIAVEPDPTLASMFDEAGGQGKPRVGQLPVCFDTDREAAVERAHRLFKWFGGGWKVNAELPRPQAFDDASRFVRPEDVAESIPCGSDVDGCVAAVKKFADAGFTHVALVQVGGDEQLPFITWAEKELLGALRA
jgi:G6PDH family F420-dependent oxidoreductase